MLTDLGTPEVLKSTEASGCVGSEGIGMGQGDSEAASNSLLCFPSFPQIRSLFSFCRLGVVCVTLPLARSTTQCVTKWLALESPLTAAQENEVASVFHVASPHPRRLGH